MPDCPELEKFLGVYFYSLSYVARLGPSCNKKLPCTNKVKEKCPLFVNKKY